MAADRPTHLDEAGRAQMVDVTGKDETVRRAVARGRIRMAPATLEALRSGSLEKGEAFAVARLAGIQAGKKTADLIPLCHALPGASVTVDLDPDDALPGVVVTAEARYRGRTGVEMEALTAVSVALLTLYDMAKALDRGMTMESVRLVSKEGGASGSWSAE
ncbi:cyclic pyranopterin monophosphate synthase MoaC [Gemmatimonadota bacterium DH-20]|uniref:Cyclic pyranopterin monophosphate synthase n=1 Tax=Gaopeijia maritima TaxID=3119007 RepID=A0ABU9E7I4_9BACT